MIVLGVILLALACAMVVMQWKLKKFWKENSGQRKPLTIGEAFSRHAEFGQWFESYSIAQKNMLKKAMSKKGWEKKFQHAAKNDPRFSKMKKDTKSVQKMGQTMEFSAKYVLPVLTKFAKYGFTCIAIAAIVAILCILYGVFG